MKKQIIVLLLAATTLGSCGIYGKYKPTEIEDSANLYGKTDSVVVDSIDNIATLKWQELFTDSKLQSLIDSALINNIDIQSAELKIEAASAALMSAKLSYLPSVGLAPSINYDYSKTGGNSTSYTLPATASWEVDIFGSLTNAKRGTAAVLKQTEEYKQYVRTNLIAGVANTYYTLLMLDEQLQIAIDTKEAWDKSVKTATAMKRAGLLNEAGLAQTEATYFNICTQVIELENSITQAENALNLLLARTPQDVPRGELSAQSMPEYLTIGIPLQMIANRPDVRQAEYNLEEAFYATNSARSAFYPKVTLSGSAGWTSTIGAAVNPLSFIASAVGSLVQPLFNKGTNVAQLKIAKAQQEEAKLAFQYAILSAGSEVNSTISAYQAAKNKDGLYLQQIESLTRASKSTKLLMKYGDTTYLEVLTAELTLLNAQLESVANQFTQLQEVVNLYKALGGGREE